MPRGSDRPLYILPFDHRGSFETNMFGWKGDLNGAQTAEIATARRVIFDGFRAAIAGGVPKAKAGILVDEQFGTAILRDAKAAGFPTAGPAEKSGQEEFDFQCGEDCARHIEAFGPTLSKVLVRCNPRGDRAVNKAQAVRLKRLSDYLAEKGQSRFLFELLVPAEKAQLEKLPATKRPMISSSGLVRWLALSRNSRPPASNPTYGRPKASIGGRAARRSPRPHGPAGAIRSGASSSAAVRTTEK
jgi:myo-inositol catabolism protein IolC